MGEKYSVMMDGREPWFHRNNYPMTHDEVCETLNTQSAEIAGLRRKLEDSQASHLAHHKVLERVTKANGRFAEGLGISKALNDAQMVDRLRMESEIAGLRNLLKRMVDEFHTPYGISICTIFDAEKALGNPSEIPNSSEVQDA